MKKKFGVILIVTLLIFGFSCANKAKNEESESTEMVNDAGIKFFEGSFNDAKAKAKAENKLIFMDAYTSWCGPCKMMKKNTFPDALVGKLFNEKFVSVAYDMEVGEGVDLAELYQVQGYPTLLFLDAEGKVLKNELGYRDPAGLMALGQELTKN